MDKKSRLDKLRYHWFSYVARGGLNTPRMNIGRLENGGLIHWTLFLQMSRAYIKDFPRDTHDLEGFVPKGMMKLVTGA